MVLKDGNIYSLSRNIKNKVKNEKWSQAYQGPFTQRDAIRHARSILNSVNSSPYIDKKTKLRARTKVVKRVRGYQVLVNNY